MFNPHPGSMNILFADGSVRGFRGVQDPAVWVAYCTRNGGEMISEP
jgi:prepilin-type processing-associated H-X9-DG protein